MKKIIQSFALFMCFFVFSNCTVPTFALVMSDSDEESVTLQQACESYAESFIRHVEDDDSFDVLGSTEVYNVFDELIGYDVSFEKNGTPSGHAFVDFTSENNLVTEYSVEGYDVASIIEENISIATATSARTANTSTPTVTKLYRTLPMCYSAELSNAEGNVYYDTNQGIISQSKFAQQKTASQQSLASQTLTSHPNNAETLDSNIIQDIIIEEDEIDSTYELSAEDYIPDGRLVGYVGQLEPYDSYFGGDSGRTYGCTPVAVTNAIYYMENKRDCDGILIEHNWFKTYDVIYQLLFTQQGGTFAPNSSLPIIIPAYANARGFIGNYITFNAYSFDNIKSQVSLDRPILFHYNTTIFDGHSIFVLGWREYTDTNDDLHRYMTCANGWNPYVTAFSYDDIPPAMLCLAGAMLIYK